MQFDSIILSNDWLLNLIIASVTDDFTYSGLSLGILSYEAFETSGFTRTDFSFKLVIVTSSQVWLEANVVQLMPLSVKNKTVKNLKSHLLLRFMSVLNIQRQRAEPIYNSGKSHGVNLVYRTTVSKETMLCCHPIKASYWFLYSSHVFQPVFKFNVRYCICLSVTHFPSKVLDSFFTLLEITFLVLCDDVWET